VRPSDRIGSLVPPFLLAGKVFFAWDIAAQIGCGIAFQLCSIQENKGPPLTKNWAEPRFSRRPGLVTAKLLFQARKFF
jgi:hypothetical protein